MKAIVEALQQANIEVREHESMREHTTWKIGGPADLFIQVENAEQLQVAMKILHQVQVPWTVIGRGSNTLVEDKGIRGAVLKLGRDFESLEVDDTSVTVGGAYSFIKLSVMVGKEGLTGLEYAGGIPGSVGGAVYMNAGAHGSDISHILDRAEVVFANGDIRMLTNADFHFEYRHSLLHEQPGIVTKAVFALQYGDRKEIAAAMASYKERRLRTQPLQMACAGSVFRNPDGDFAARLIEQAGLKGLRRGGAEISTLHANFIVNHGDATAEDVLGLMAEVQRIIHEKNQISLVPEVLRVGER
jgi:UDP-N-acetylmuramate dehydrogenase